MVRNSDYHIQRIGIPAELLKFGSEQLYKAIHHVIGMTWEEEEMPSDWLDGFTRRAILQIAVTFEA